MKKTIVILVSLLVHIGFAQETPIALAKQLLSLEGMLDTSNLYSDELDLRPQGFSGMLMSNTKEYQNKKNFLPDFTDLISTHSFSFREFPISPQYQIINITALDSSKLGFDFYLHFKKKQDLWQLKNVCRLEHATVAELWMANLSELEVDSIINSPESQKIIYSKKQYYAIKSLYKLTMGFDDTILDYFNSNKASFLALNDSYNHSGKGLLKYGTLANLNKDELLITEINHYDFSSNTLTFFYIRNTFKGAVGYLRTPNKNILSQLIESGNIFFIREIGEGWYMFKSEGK
jgi:hypothetical protein